MGSGKSSPTRQWFEPENVLRLDVHPRKRVELVAAARGEGGAADDGDGSDGGGGGGGDLRVIARLLARVLERAL